MHKSRQENFWMTICIFYYAIFRNKSKVVSHNFDKERNSKQKISNNSEGTKRKQNPKGQSFKGLSFSS